MVFIDYNQTATLNLQSFSLTQAIAYKLLDAWGYEGFRTHAEQVSMFYSDKRDIAMEKYFV